MLVNFVEKHFLQQQIKEGTRKEAILDLIFTSDESLVLQCTQINNVKLTDHKTCVAQLSYQSNPEKKEEKKNFKTTKIPEYDTAGADEEDWLRASKLLDMVSWKEVLANKSENEVANIILNKMEDVVMKTMHLKVTSEKHTNTLHEEGRQSPETNTFRSNNLIPRKVRKEMRRKFEASESLKTVTSVKRCLRLREKLEKAEDELKEMYNEKKLKNENIAIAKIKRNPKVFFSMAKKKQKNV